MFITHRMSPGLSVLDGVGLIPTLDLNFTEGRTIGNRLVQPPTITEARASSALYFQNPMGNSSDSYTMLYGNNVLRHGENRPVWLGTDFRGLIDTQERWIGLLVEGADQNIITNNYIYAAPNWTLAGAPTVTDDTLLDIYDGRGFRIINGAAGEDYIYQTHLLTGAKYIVCFILYAYGNPTPSDSDVRIAAGLSGSIAGVASTFEQIQGEIWLVWAEITGTAVNWDVGVNVRGNKTVRMTLLSCYLSAPSNEGGAFPRSPIPSGGAATTRAADNWSCALTASQYGQAAGTVDIEAVAPCSYADASTLLNFWRITNGAANSYVGIGYLPATDSLRVNHTTGGVTRTADGNLAGLARGDIVRLRVAYDSTGTIDGTNNLIAWQSINGGAYTKIAQQAAALGGSLTSDTLYLGGQHNTRRYLSSAIRRIRIFNRAINGAPGDW